MGIVSTQKIAIFYAARCNGFKLRVTIVSSDDSVGADLALQTY
jgi:hypothetical protein